MGLRTRLKRRVKHFLTGAQTPSSSPQPPSAPASADGRLSEATQAPPPQKAAPPPTSTAGADTPPADDKVARHFERTRRAVLRFIDEAGGTASLADMHELSERKYFIGHKRFSDLMETLVDASLIDFDHSRGEAHLTEAGRTLAHTPMPRRS